MAVINYSTSYDVITDDVFVYIYLGEDQSLNF